ncbi:MAG: hypothetical protein LBC67_05285 [Spirochaetales bacterium]|jgi:hypothetical protein|nr:hypothetical protein [Spirochaetales bacterium]
MKRTKSFLRVGIALLALSGILFAGCSSGSDDDGPPPPTKPVAPISGEKVYTSAGAEYSGADITFTTVQNGWTNTNETLTELGLTDADVKVTNNKLTLDMGTKSVAEGRLVNLGGDGYTVTPSTARFYQLWRFKDGSNNDVQHLKVEGGQIKEHASLFYATEAATVVGNDNGTPINLNFGKGWTWLINVQTESGGIPNTRSPDASFKWYINFPDHS